MSLSTQPKETLNTILNRSGIPLLKRMRLRAVSTSFDATLDYGLQRETSLVIRVLDPEDVKMVKEGHLHVQPNDLLVSVANFTQNRNGLDLIQRLFPRVTELTFISSSLATWRKAPELLGLYAPTLTSLQVAGYTEWWHRSKASGFPRLVETINSMVNLSSLSLPLHGYSRFLPKLGPTLARLERLSMERPINWKNAKFIAASLSSRCTHLRLNFREDLSTFKPLCEAINLTYLHLEYYDGRHLLQFVGQLVRLTTLILHDGSEPGLGTLLPRIRLPLSVTQVTLLGLRYYGRPPLEPPASKKLAFSSVKELTLQISYFPDSSLDYLTSVATWFPSLSTCALHVNEDYHEEILSNQQALPYTVKVLPFIVKLEPTF